MTTDMTLDALEQAIWARQVIGSVGDAYDNALAETVIGLFKTEVIYKKSPWKNYDAAEYATLDWVSWFNNKRLLEPIGNIPSAEYEEMYYTRKMSLAHIAGLA